MSLKKHQEEWDGLADIDPLWSILSDPNHKFNKWNVDKFFLTGKNEIEQAMNQSTGLGYPHSKETVLDFGCGVGRLTRPLSKYFKQCIGVDVSGEMISQANKINSHISNLKFIMNDKQDLKLFENNYFDMIYTNIVLQHVPNKSIIKSYLIEFMRTLKTNGLLVFQLPGYIPFKYRFQIKRKLFLLLNFFKFSNKILHEKLGLSPIRMNYIPKKEVVDLLNFHGAKILKIEKTPYNRKSTQSIFYYVTK